MIHGNFIIIKRDTYIKLNTDQAVLGDVTVIMTKSNEAKSTWVL